MIALIDANNFFVSCERVFNPKIWQKPVVVLSNNDGCVIARSDEAKKCGIAMGIPLFKIRDIIKFHNVYCYTSNFSLYGDFSARMMSMLKKNCQHVEVYSIDEAFLDLEGLDDIAGFCANIHEKIWKGLSLPTSIGIAQTKTLAKIANHIAKKNKQPVFYLDQYNINSTLKNFPIDEVWGIGRRLADKLHLHGFHTALDLKNMDPRLMRKIATVVGERVVRELNGMSCLKVNDIRSDRKGIQVSRSFEGTYQDKEKVYQALSIYLQNLCAKLRKENKKTKNLCVYLKTSPHKKNFIRHVEYFSLDMLTDNPSYILKKYIKPWINSVFKKNTPYKKAGIISYDLSSYETMEKNLFYEEQETPLSSKVLKIMDHINSRFGKKTMYFCSAGILKEKKTHFLQSPAYTTRWKDVMRVQ